MSDDIVVQRKGKKNEVLVRNNTGVNYFNEPTRRVRDQEFLAIDPLRSKFGASVLLGLQEYLPKKNDVLLYLGASAGYTVSFLANIASLVFAVEQSCHYSR